MKVGTWMRDKKTGETVKIKAIGLLVEYGNDRIGSAFVQEENLSERFDLLDDPSDRDDIECLLKAKVEADEAETGLYDCGLAFVIVDRVSNTKGADEITFQWFERAMPLNDVLAA